MEFRVLGPLEARDGRGPLELGGTKPRAVLAMLLLQPNAPVAPEHLAIGLWGDDVPPTALKTIHVHVSRLRKALGDADRIETTRAGYRLSVGPDELDLLAFQRDVQAARALTDQEDWAAASALLRAALARWRGPPLADLEKAPFAAVQIRQLEEERRSALEARIAADLAAGHHDALIGELRRLVAEHPTRERLTQHLMLALYRGGRQSEALAAYTALRRLLDEEHGLVPGPELQRLQAAVLRQDPALDLAPAVVIPPPTTGPRASEGAFVGREAHLAQLRARWLDSTRGQTELVLLVGEAGVGKTRLAARFADDARREGAAVLYGRADAEALLPYQVFVEALNHLLAHAGGDFVGEIPGELSRLGRILPEAPADTRDADHATERYQVFDAVVSILKRAARRWPVVLVLDDLHWADTPTLHLIRHLLRHADGSRLLVLGTFRDAEVGKRHPLTGVLSDLRRERRFERIALAGFDDATTGALVADRLERPVTTAFVQRLREQTDGNAFFIEETLRALSESRWQDAPVVDEDAIANLGVPEGVAEVILRRVRQLSPVAEELLRAASVVGPTFPLAALEPLLDVGPDALVTAIDECLAARLVVEVHGQFDVFTFAHALVREVLYGQLSDARRVRVHLRLARELERSADANPAELAHHFALAAPLAGPEPGCRYSIAAGHRAAEAFAYDEAASHFRVALRLADPLDASGRCDVQLALGRVQWHAGDDGARATFREAAESALERGAATQLARAALGLGERYFEVTYLGTRYRELLETALVMIGPEPRPERALLLSRLATTLGFPSETPRSIALADQAVAMARELGDERLLAAVLMAAHVTLLDVRHIPRRLEIERTLQALALEHRELLAERHQWHMYDLLHVGAIDAARAEHAGLLRLSGELGQPLFRSLAEGARGLWAELAGDLEQADRHAEASLLAAREAHTGDAVSSWASQLFAMRRVQGRVGELTHVVERLVAKGGYQLGWRSALGVLYLDTGNLAGARRCFEEEVGEGVHAIPRGMFWLTRTTLLGELCAGLGEADVARALYAELLPFRAYNVVVAYCSLLGPVEGYLGLLAGAMGDAPRAAEHTRAALTRVRAMPAPVLERVLAARLEAPSAVA
ncbi:AAA family ATPase [Solirubrobacter phytolaccae]|uniref:AAA family ATPase n=1 Tax=Solirubrobacter phytolaccae TaxID=1404360 RepID=A0A9X3NCD8_9ACTN|nr:BTAD domain-containing putative transcriptional regulator [Solirubrobacter phytolaccae]MDA0182197.1 AAA family ATPase [Solirubrobacter phytolaccae]